MEERNGSIGLNIDIDNDDVGKFDENIYFRWLVSSLWTTAEEIQHKFHHKKNLRHRYLSTG
jgi:hypothetical protein